MKILILFLAIMTTNLHAGQPSVDLVCAGLFSRAYQQSYNNEKQDAARYYGSLAVAIGYHTVMTKIAEGGNPDVTITTWDGAVKEMGDAMDTATALLYYTVCVDRGMELLKIRNDIILKRNSHRD